jgi:glycosyltransferase involved in cell wall biosynthesis
MSKIKMHILYNFQEGPWGGGNQFLKALKKELERMGVYEESPDKAEVILFNSHHCLDEVLDFKKNPLKKVLIHRVDGPITYVRGRDKIIDEIIFQVNKLIVDGTIFQSSWSRQKNYEIGMKNSPYETIITNAPDSRVFNPKRKKYFDKKKIRLIATSWSANVRKGFDIYKYLDENIDFNKYEMTFVGNSPITFKNIKWIKPLSSEKLAQILKQHDIYIIASQNEPCSNALIEALTCGLPAVVLNNGGHPELVQNGGELFNGKEDVIEKLESIVKNYHYYQSKIPKFSIQKVAQQYYEFAQKIYKDAFNGRYNPKQVNFLNRVNFYKIKFIIWKRDKTSKNKGIKERIWRKII